MNPYMITRRRRRGLPLAVYVIALLLIPLAAVGWFSVREVERNNVAAKNAAAISGAVAVHTAAASAIVPLDVERSISLGLAVDGQNDSDVELDRRLLVARQSTDDVLDAFRPYYRTATLTDVSDPQLVHDLAEKLRAARIFQWSEVEQFCTAFYQKGKSDNALSSICKPAVDRWGKRYALAVDTYKVSLDMLERTRRTGDAVLIGNAENALKECRQEKDALEIFKKDLGTFVRFYEFISQIVPFDDLELEKLCLFARKLRPLLREWLDDNLPNMVETAVRGEVERISAKSRKYSRAADKD